jgi:hypothetical protein
MKGRLFRSTMLAVVVMLVLAGSVSAADSFTISAVSPDTLSGGVTITFAYSGLTVNDTSLRLAIWEPQDNKSFQTLADWGATLQLLGDGTGGTVTVPQVIAAHAGDQPCPALKFQLKVGKVTSNIFKLLAYCPTK